jgi:hypothetical protein
LIFVTDGLSKQETIMSKFADCGEGQAARPAFLLVPSW